MIQVANGVCLKCLESVGVPTRGARTTTTGGSLLLAALCEASPVRLSACRHQLRDVGATWAQQSQGVTRPPPSQVGLKPIRPLVESKEM